MHSVTIRYALRLADLPRATRNMTLFSAAWGFRGHKTDLSLTPRWLV